LPTLKEGDSTTGGGRPRVEEGVAHPLNRGRGNTLARARPDFERMCKKTCRKAPKVSSKVN